MKHVKVDVSLYIPVDFSIEQQEDVEAAIAFANQVIRFHLKQAGIMYELIETEEDNEDLIIDVD